jgi:hypothetical protein
MRGSGRIEARTAVDVYGALATLHAPPDLIMTRYAVSAVTANTAILGPSRWGR